MPTFQKKVYAGFLWEIGTGTPGLPDTATSAPNGYLPQWVQTGALDLTPGGGNLHPWNATFAGNAVVPPTMGGAPKGLTQVDLIVERNGRRYHFNYVFSGVGMRY